MSLYSPRKKDVRPRPDRDLAINPSSKPPPLRRVVSGKSTAKSCQFRSRTVSVRLDDRESSPPCSAPNTTVDQNISCSGQAGARALSSSSCPTSFLSCSSPSLPPSYPLSDDAGDERKALRGWKVKYHERESGGKARKGTPAQRARGRGRRSAVYSAAAAVLSLSLSHANAETGRPRGAILSKFSRVSTTAKWMKYFVVSQELVPRFSLTK